MDLLMKSLINMLYLVIHRNKLLLLYKKIWKGMVCVIVDLIVIFLL